MKCLGFVIAMVVGFFAINGKSFAAFPYDNSNWRQVWGDEFNGTTLDRSKWDYNYYWGDAHNHAAYMRSDHVTVADGLLTLKATPGIPSGEAQWQNDYYMGYTSGAINSANHYVMNQDDGYIEARMKMPGYGGTWAAFWMLSRTGKWPPELDVMEHPINDSIHANAQNNYYMCFHGYESTYNNNDRSWGQWKEHSAPLYSEWHNYGCKWDKSAGWVEYYWDGQKVASFNVGTKYFQSSNGFKDMYLILNLAVGGWADTDGKIWTTTIADSFTESKFQIDYVRVFDTSPVPEPATWVSLISGGFAIGLWYFRRCGMKNRKRFSIS